MDNDYISNLFSSEINIKKFHPLSIRKSKKVMTLLIKHWSTNYDMANIWKEKPTDYIKKIRRNKSKINEKRLLKEWYNMFQEVNNKLNYNSWEIETLDLIDLKSDDIFLDIWANKLSTINYLADKYKDVRFYGLDMIPQCKTFIHPERCTYFHIKEKNRNIPLENNTVSVIHIQFVLHHVKNKAMIKRILEECTRVIKKWWRLIFWEESFRQWIDSINKLVKKNQNIWVMTDYDLTKEFFDLTEKQRWEFIIVNDRLINCENSHMQWTWQYYMREDWIKQIEKFWFKLSSDYEFGLRINGKIKQWVRYLWKFIMW